MEQLELFQEPGTELERLWEENAMLKEKVSNICRSLYGKLDALKEQIHSLQADNAILKQKVGIKENVEILFEMDKAS
jgi:hypothetical protein